MAELIPVRPTRHLSGGYAPGYVYLVDPDDPRVARHIANRGLVPHPDVAAEAPVDDSSSAEGEPAAEAPAAPEAPAEEPEATIPEE